MAICLQIDSLLFFSEIEWSVQVSTGNDPEASTTSNVFIVLFGSKKQSHEIALGLPDASTGLTFGNGKTKVFEVKGFFLTVLKLQIV